MKKQRKSKKIPANLLDRRWVGGELKRFREQHGFKNQKSLQLAAGLVSLSRNEDGSQFPNWATVVKVAYACGTTVTQFFADLEPMDSVPDVLRYPEETRLLHAILDLSKSSNLKDREVAEWLRGNLITFHERWV